MREYKEEQENICLTDARSFASILIKGATDRRLAPVRVQVKNDRHSLLEEGRSFLCLIIALRTQGITKSKAFNA